jgi:hypothetical protein
LGRDIHASIGKYEGYLESNFWQVDNKTRKGTGGGCYMHIKFY